MRRGFSLVELSIVLVILGLLVGGVLAGQSLIRASELRALHREYNGYITSINTFRDKYFALPGDILNATQLWGRQYNHATCPTNSSAAVSTSGTCDGNGNGLIVTTGPQPDAPTENMQFWRHLALAGMIEGTFSGVAGSNSANDCTVGDNCPKSKVGQAGWMMVYLASSFTDDGLTYARTDYGNHLGFGARRSSNGQLTDPALSPEEAWNIDTKTDDGKPAYGSVIARGYNDTCASADDGSSARTDFVASYRLSATGKQCSLIFLIKK